MSSVRANKNKFPLVLPDFLPSNCLFEKDFNQSMAVVTVKENDNHFTIEFVTPDYKKNDFRINIEEGFLTILAKYEDGLLKLVLPKKKGRNSKPKKSI